ncbi:MAG: transaldolase [Chloroflexota bacterium]|nr:MAG: transaldolase [Chloroflexota bacterium]
MSRLGGIRRVIDGRSTALRVRVFADGADLASIARLAQDGRISGFTTNPTLMRRAGVQDYRAFARDALAVVGDRPISFEVFADDFPTMERQAIAIASWGRNVNVKIPVTDGSGTFSGPLIGRLTDRGVAVNVTAIMAVEQVGRVVACLAGKAPSFVSVFAGRVADTGVDPLPLMAQSVSLVNRVAGAQLIWASPREILNLYQADEIGCHVITMTPDLLAKLDLHGKDLEGYSLETVRQFRDDAARAGYAIDTSAT